MKKGIFIPDITVEMFRNASLEAVEELLVSGTMEDIEIPEQPHGEWKPDGTCSECGVYSSLNKNSAYFCPNCGADMRKKESARNDG